MSNPDKYITGHPYTGDGGPCVNELKLTDVTELCSYSRAMHADPGSPIHLIRQYPHEFVRPPEGGDHCAFSTEVEGALYGTKMLQTCGYPESEHYAARKPQPVGALVRKADVAQYARAPMPDRARAGITVTLIDAPIDPLGTLAVLTGMYEGRVARSKSEVDDAQRRAAYDAMMATVLSGPLEAVQFTFLIEGVSRAITHQMVRNRFSFFAQESLRFAVAEDWAQEVPLPPSLAGRKEDDPLVMVWRRALNQAEDSYAASVAAGMPAEEARGLLPHAITTRLYWTVSLRTLLTEAGKRTCTQAQFDWRILFGGIAKAFRERGNCVGTEEYFRLEEDGGQYLHREGDGWQYELFAEAIRPVCYQQGKCGFMAKFDRGCTIRGRVDAFERNGIPSSEWDVRYDKERGTQSEMMRHINPQEWAADPAAARVMEEK